MIRHALSAIVIVVLSSPLYGQGLARERGVEPSLAAAPSPRTAFQPPPQPPLSVSPSHRPRLSPPRRPQLRRPDSAPQGAPHTGGDLFLAHRATYAPRFEPHRGNYPYAPLVFPPFSAHLSPAPVFVQTYGEHARVHEGSWDGERYGTAAGDGADGRTTGYLRLEVQPATARVFVDGVLVGTVADFGAALPLGPGLHRIALEADGFDGAAFAVRVRSNEGVRYAGRLAPRPVDDERSRPAAAPAAAKTLYVIPRCYAGDRVPQPVDLRAGCRLDDLRVIAPAR